MSEKWIGMSKTQLKGETMDENCSVTINKVQIQF